MAWVLLDEDDNEPRLFWTYVLSALNTNNQNALPDSSNICNLQGPTTKVCVDRCYASSLAEQRRAILLILDDYHVITQKRYIAFSYLVEHLPAQLHIILATRADPALPLSAAGTRTATGSEHAKVRCTVEETRDFFQEAMGIQFPDDTIQQVTARTEGWLVGLQLLGLSLPELPTLLKLLEELRGNQRYILDYLIDEVLRRQPQDVQTFLLCTSILERLTASLCDAVMKQMAASKCSNDSNRPIYLSCPSIARENGIAITPSLPKPYATSWSRPA